MRPDVLSLLVLSLGISAAHAAMPNHWMPMVFAGRAQGWSLGRTLSITAVAGGGHVVMTSLLGLLLVWLGGKVAEAAETWAKPLTAAVLIVFGLAYIVAHFTHVGLHSHHGHDHEEAECPSRVRDGVAIGSLVAMLTFSPCEAFLPVYLTAVQHGWWVFVMLTLILAAGTLGGMLLLTWLSFVGLSRVNLRFLQHNEQLVLGSLIAVLGVSVLVIH